MQSSQECEENCGDRQIANSDWEAVHKIIKIYKLGLKKENADGPNERNLFACETYMCNTLQAINPNSPNL